MLFRRTSVTSCIRTDTAHSCYQKLHSTHSLQLDSHKHNSLRSGMLHALFVLNCSVRTFGRCYVQATQNSKFGRCYVQATGHSKFGRCYVQATEHSKFPSHLQFCIWRWWNQHCVKFLEFSRCYTPWDVFCFWGKVPGHVHCQGVADQTSFC